MEELERYVKLATSLGNGSPEVGKAMARLGELYESGAVGPADYGAAYRWYVTASYYGEDAAYERAKALRGRSLPAWDAAVLDAARASAEKGDTGAMLTLYYRYAEGIGVTKDDKTAAEWCFMAAEAGDPAAQCMIGNPRLINFRLSELAGPELPWLEKAADQLYPIAIHMLGDTYAEGMGVRKNALTATKYYRAAAKTGFLPSMVSLAELLLMKKNSPESWQEAVDWLEKAVSLGSVSAAYTLASVYCCGENVPKDPDKAAGLYRFVAAKGGNDFRVSMAKEKLKTLESRTGGTAPTATITGTEIPAAKKKPGSASPFADVREPGGIGSIDPLPHQTAAKKKKGSASPFADVREPSGIGSIDPPPHSVSSSAAKTDKKGSASPFADVHEPSDIFANLEKSATEGDAAAMCVLGTISETEKFGRYDLAASVRWYRMAAEAGFPEGQYRLGAMYKIGRGVEKDDVQAVYWLKKAADQGHAAALYGLGCMVLTGNGTAQDRNEALRLLRLSAAKGYGDAQKLLDGLV